VTSVRSRESLTKVADEGYSANLFTNDGT